MNNIPSFYKLLFDQYGMLVKYLHELAKIFFLVAHLNIDVDSLEHWQHVLRVKFKCEIFKHISSLFQVKVSQWTQ